MRLIILWPLLRRRESSSCEPDAPARVFRPFTRRRVGLVSHLPRLGRISTELRGTSGHPASAAGAVEDDAGRGAGALGGGGADLGDALGVRQPFGPALAGGAEPGDHGL